MRSKLRIGTRGSALALRQASWVAVKLQEHFQGLEVELVTIKTQGDKVLDVALAKVGGKGLFVKELEEALLTSGIDLAVHSMKDMPTALPSGLQITAITEREDPRDVLVSKDGRTLEWLRKGAVIGTSSLRRRAQLLYYRPDLQVIPLRGNLDTRIRKLDTEGLDAVVLAAAGIRRMGLEAKITQVFSPDDFVPAIGQGALGIETRADDEEINQLVGALDHTETRLCVQAEQAFLAKLEGGCQVPIGAHASIRRREFNLHGMVAHLDGRPMYREEIRGDLLSTEGLGEELAERILNRGASAILRALYAVSEGL